MKEEKPSDDLSAGKAQSRIWELDLLRGAALLFMVFDHVVFDLSEFFGVDTEPLGIFKEGVGCISAGMFMLICGIGVTLGRKTIRRGLFVFSLGMVLTLASFLAGLVIKDDLTIKFGILHFLGLAMIIGHFVKKLPKPVILLLLMISAALGIVFSRVTVGVGFLFPLGLCSPSFFSSDYFPLFPNLACVFGGILIGQLVYKERKSVFRFRPKRSLLCFFGRHTLLLYFIHQPIIIALLFLGSRIFG